MNASRIITLALACAMPAVVVAHEPGGMGGMGGTSATGGPGMLTVADDGSLLVTDVGSGMMGGGSVQPDQRELVNISAAGQLRWRATFDDGWPMMPVTEGDLVVLALREDWWMGGGPGGDGGPPGGGGHGGGGGGGGGGGMPGDPHADSVTLVGLDLATGAERWRTEVDGDMASLPQFAPDGSRFYLTVRDFAPGFQMPGTPMQQGSAPSGAMLMSTTVVAVNRSGTVLWSFDLSDNQP